MKIGEVASGRVFALALHRNTRSTKVIKTGVRGANNDKMAWGAKGQRCKSKWNL